MAQSNNNSVTPLSAEQYSQLFRKFFPVPETMPKGGDQQSDTLSVGNYIFDPIATKQSDRFFTCKMR